MTSDYLEALGGRREGEGEEGGGRVGGRREEALPCVLQSGPGLEWSNRREEGGGGSVGSNRREGWCRDTGWRRELAGRLRARPLAQIATLAITIERWNLRNSR